LDLGRNNTIYFLNYWHYTKTFIQNITGTRDYVVNRNYRFLNVLYKIVFVIFFNTGRIGELQGNRQSINNLNFINSVIKSYGVNRILFFMSETVGTFKWMTIGWILLFCLLGVLWFRLEYLFLVRHYGAHNLFHVGGLLGFTRMTKNRHFDKQKILVRNYYFYACSLGD
jgi:uncharacterized membrane protein